MPGNPLGNALRELRAWGFRPSGSRAGVRSFVGNLDCRGQPVGVEFHIHDWDFLTYPPIRVLDGIDRDTLAPHIDPDGWLCYLQRGSVVLDRYAPAIAISQCLEQARRVLEAIKFDPNYRTADTYAYFSLSPHSSSRSSQPALMLEGGVEIAYLAKRLA
jgi:hypothetical protein